MDQFERLRPVGRLEQYSTARHHARFYLNVAVTATYKIPDSFALPVKDYVYRACETLIAQHPVLSAIPVDDDTQHPYFVRLPQIDLDKSVFLEQRQRAYPATDINGEPAPDLELTALLETQHNTPFSAPNTFWRLCVLLDNASKHHFTAAFVYHHALGDGNSGKAFHQTFLRALGATSAGDAKSLITPPQLPLLPNLEALHPLPLSFTFLAKALIKAKIWSPRNPGLWTGSKIQTPPTTRVRLVPFSKALVTALRARCRQECTTITAVLQTIIARSLFAHLPSTFSQLTCSGALSCRRFLSDTITDDSIGVWVQDFEEIYSRQACMPPDTSFPWPEAKRSRQTIESVLSRQGKDAGPNLLKYVGDYQQDLCYSKVGTHRDKSYEMSNIGAVPSDSDPSKSSIGAMVFSQSASVIGSAIEVSVVTGGDGCLVLAISWQGGVVDEQLVQAVIEKVREELHGLTGNK